VAPISHDPVGEKSEVYDAISSAAAHIAETINADAIICQTASGVTATTMAAQRPNLPIVSVTTNERVANQLALYYANSAFVRPFFSALATRQA
jgi:pyruvate kinase